jgi:hypothetical protein
LQLSQTTKELALTPYDPESWLNRAQTLRILGFPELGLGDAYKSRLLVESALENSSETGTAALKAFSAKIYHLHVTSPGLEQHVATPELLQLRVTAMLKRLEIQCWTELMEGLMACNCCNDYIQLSKAAVEKFPGDAVFQSELDNANAWYGQRVDQLQARVDSDEMSAEEMESTLLNGGVYPTPYPWMTKELLERDDALLKSIQGEFKFASTNCTAVRSTIRNTEGEEVADVLGVVALRDITQGETVVFETTLQGVIGNTKRCETCCGQITSPVLNECCSITYCSTTCSSIALTTFHPALCGKDFSTLQTAAASAVLTTDFALDALLMLRTLALSLNEPIHPLQNTHLARLTPSYGGSSPRLIIFSLDEHIIKPLSMLQKLGVDIFTNAHYDTWVLHTIRCRLQNNKHGHTLDEACGTAVSGLYSMFNHSCAPNVDWRHDDGSSTVTMFAERGVKEGEEMFISYIRGKKMGRAERQRTLMPWFGTECRCERCIAEGDAEITPAMGVLGLN